MKLPINFRIRIGYFLFGVFLGVVSLFFQVKQVEAFYLPFPGLPNLPSLFRLIPFPALPGLKSLPTLKPLQPFNNPFETPTLTPTLTPTMTPTSTPTNMPTPTLTDTPTPTLTPSLNPTETPTLTPTLTPTETPTPSPTETQTPTLTETPTSTPTETLTPTLSPTPTEIPTPTITETLTPTETPTPTVTPTPQVFGSVVINEIMWAGSTESSADEWIELKNTTSSPIDLTNWEIDNLGSSTTPNIIIPTIVPNRTIDGDGYYVIANNLKSSSILNIDPDFHTTAVSLLNSGEQLTLKNNNGDIVDIANHTGSWFTGNDILPNKSMARKSPPDDGSLPDNWFTSTGQTNLDLTASESATPKSANN